MTVRWKENQRQERLPRAESDIDGFHCWADPDGRWHVFCTLPNIGSAMVDGVVTRVGGAWAIGNRDHRDRAKERCVEVVSQLKELGAKGR